MGFFSDPRAQHGSGTEQGASREEVKDKVTILDLTISLRKVVRGKSQKGLGTPGEGGRQRPGDFLDKHAG